MSKKAADAARDKKPERERAMLQAAQALLDDHPPAERALQPRLPDAGRLHRRHRLLGRLQHRDGGHQHRDLLHRLPRDARQRVRRTQDAPSTTPTARACAPSAPTATCRTTGPTRSRARCRPPRRCGARSSAPSTRREKFQAHAARAGAARMGALQGQRLAGVPQLPQLRVDGLHAPERARAEHALAPTWPARRRPASTATRASRTGCRTSRRAKRPPTRRGR